MLPPDMTTAPLDRQSIIWICQHTGAQGIITPPSMIQDFRNDKGAFGFLKSLKYVCYLGADLDHKVGDELTPYTNLFPVIESTERGGRLSFESGDPMLWKSYHFVPEMGSRFEQVGEDLYELHIDRTSEYQFFQCGFYTFPDVNSIRTEELHSPVVDQTSGTTRWVSRGRKDDLVKLSWLAKFHSSHIEDAIAHHPIVCSAVVGGEGRSIPYIITEPRDQNTVGDPDKFIDGIYDTVIYRVNEKDDDQIRIPREMVMLADPALPFKRTLKMTVMRKEVEKTYKPHIEALYRGRCGVGGPVDGSVDDCVRG